MKACLPRRVGLEQEATLFIGRIPQVLENILDSVGLICYCVFIFLCLKLLSSDLVVAL